MKVLITGFEPFDNEKINPAYEAVKLLKQSYGSIKLIKKELPTVFHKSIKTLRGYIEKEKPDAVLCIGQAGGVFAICIERVAINVDDARIKDNEGNKPVDKKIYEDGENAYFSTLPIKAIQKNMNNKKIPAIISNSAGTFVCNHIMYGLLYMVKKEFTNVKNAGFIHVPYIPEQVIDKKNMPSMDLRLIVEALEIAIKTLLNKK